MIAPVLAFTKFTVREAVKNRIIWIAIVIAVAGFGLATFVSEMAIMEGEDIQLTLLAATYRFAAVFVMMIFVISTIVREFNDKCMDIYLSLPLTRVTFFVGKSCGFAACGLFLAALFSAALLFYGRWEHVAVWGLSLWMELVVIALVSFFCVLTFNQQITAALSVAFFFYLLSRSLESIELISQAFVMTTSLGNLVIEWLIDVLIVVLPNLSGFTRTEWLVFELPSWEDFGAVALQTAVYSLLLGALALFDFRRKNL